MTGISGLLYKALMGGMALGWLVYAIYTHQWWVLGMVPVILISSSLRVQLHVIKMSERAEDRALSATLMLLPIPVLGMFFARADLDGLPGALRWATIMLLGCVSTLLIQDWLVKKYRTRT